jgi:hypothetical protein
MTLIVAMEMEPPFVVYPVGTAFASRLDMIDFHQVSIFEDQFTPRYGAVIERLFGTTNTKFVFNLQGNTQASKTARQMTKAVNPKNQALWQLPDLYRFLCEWAYEVYDQEKRPALGQSPREAWESGLDLGEPCQDADRRQTSG